MIETTPLLCPADDVPLVPSHLQPQPQTLVLRCTECALHVYVPLPQSRQNQFTLAELEHALTEHRAILDTLPSDRHDVVSLQVYALAESLRRLNPESAVLGRPSARLMQLPGSLTPASTYLTPTKEEDMAPINPLHLNHTYRCPETGQGYTEQDYRRSMVCGCCPKVARLLVPIYPPLGAQIEEPLWTDFAAWAD